MTALGPAMRAWLRRVATAAGDGFVLRGSVPLATLSQRARTPVDIDHVVGGNVPLATLTEQTRAIVAQPDELPLELLSLEQSWLDSPSPGLRLQVKSLDDVVQVDLCTNDPHCGPAAPIDIPGVGTISAVHPETLFAWKTHGLVEYGHGRWRPKDLYDLDILSSDVPLDRDRIPDALELAFVSRNNQLSELDDFLHRPAWGEGTSNRRRWKKFARAHPTADPLPAVRDRVRAYLLQFVG